MYRYYKTWINFETGDFVSKIEFCDFMANLSIIPTCWRSIMNVDCSAVMNLLPIAQNILFLTDISINSYYNINKFGNLDKHMWPISQAHGSRISWNKTSNVSKENNQRNLSFIKWTSKYATCTHSQVLTAFQDNSH